MLFHPHRAGHELLYYPCETNMLMPGIAVINKVDTALPEKIALVRQNIQQHAHKAEIVPAESAVLVSLSELIRPVPRRHASNTARLAPDRMGVFCLELSSSQEKALIPSLGFLAVKSLSGSENKEVSYD